MVISDQLKLFRKSTGLTQEEVADKLCITRQALSNWEQGKAMPDLYAFARLAKIYKFSPDEFLLGKSLCQDVTHMKTNFSDSQIEKLIIKSYPAMTDLAPLSGGLVSQTYSFSCGEEKYIFQIGGDFDDYKKQLYIGKKYRKYIPVREVLDIFQTEKKVAYCFSKYIAGKKLFDLTENERNKLTKSIMNVLFGINQASLPDDAYWGRFDFNGNAPYKTWIDFISLIYNEEICNWSGLKDKGSCFTLIEEAIKELKDKIDYLQCEEKCLLHGDIGSYNLIAYNESITGVIDCGYALYGDPLYEMANILFWNEDKLQNLVAEIKRTYADKKSKLKLYCYTLRIGLEEIYNTEILDEIGYESDWVYNRIKEILGNGLL